jgi:hypothetical protein
MEKKKICFVICPIGGPGTEIRERSDAILNYIISPVVQGFGYEALRADKISETGMITNQVIEHLLEDPLVVADLTDHNANVYYELAIRHVVKKPVVHIIEHSQTPPFDTKDIRAIPVASQNLKIAEEAKKQISEHIEALEKNPTKIVTPISMTIDLQQIRGSGRSEDQKTSLILNQLENISTRLSSLEKTANSDLKTVFPDYPSLLSTYRLWEQQKEKKQQDEEQKKIQAAVQSLLEKHHEEIADGTVVRKAMIEILKKKSPKKE